MTKQDIDEVIRLCISFWQEELAKRFVHHRDYEEEIKFWIHWMHHAEEHHDVRALIGAFENDQLFGSALGSFAEDKDGQDAYELNVLWVYPNHRGKTISNSMIAHLINAHLPLHTSQMAVYNHHYAP